MASGIHLRTSRSATVSLTIALVLTFLLGHGLDAAAFELTHADHRVIGHEIDSSCLLMVKDPVGSDDGGWAPSGTLGVTFCSITSPAVSLETSITETKPSIHGLCVLRV